MAYTRVLPDDKLLPCPFCGKHPRCIAGFEYGRINSYMPMAMVECMGCGVFVEEIPCEVPLAQRGCNDEEALTNTVNIVVSRCR